VAGGSSRGMSPVQAKSEGSRSSRLTASSADAGYAAIGNCSTVARWPSQRRVPIREFQRIVMGHGVVHVDLLKAREPLSNHPLAWTRLVIYLASSRRARRA